MNLNEIAQPSTRYLIETFSRNTEGFVIDDLLVIAREYINESKNNKSRSVPDLRAKNTSEVTFRETPTWTATVADKLKHQPGLQAKIDAFKSSKLENKMQPYGPNDSPFVGGGPISQVMPGLRHAHITRDLSIVYNLTGSNPTIITLFGLFSHADIGTGTPANTKKQKNFAQSIKNM